MKIALVYDRVNKWGGAERVLLELHKIWPEAPLYTSIYNSSTAPWAKDFEVRTSFIQNLPLPKNAHEMYPFLMGIAFEQFNFDQFDLVISITSEFAKAIITKPATMHVCYCLNPTGYLWSGYDQYFSNKSEAYKIAVQPIISYLRFYDRIVKSRPDYYVGISRIVQDRIKKYYDANSDLIYPPVERADVLPHITSSENFYLLVARLVPNKRVDLAIEAFNALGLNLKIVGIGKEEKWLKGLAKSNIEFLGNLTEKELDTYYSKCKALIVPAEEDFGIISAEAQSFGKPVIAFGKGGACETVVEGVTGILFDSPTAQSLQKAVNSFMKSKFDPLACQKNSQKFTSMKFRNDFISLVAKLSKIN